MQIEMNNREVIIQGEGILNLIPQRPPIVMVDSFFGIEENHSYSGLTLTAKPENCKRQELSNTSLNRQRHVSDFFIPGRVKKYR